MDLWDTRILTPCSRCRGRPDSRDVTELPSEPKNTGRVKVALQWGRSRHSSDDVVELKSLRIALGLFGQMERRLLIRMEARPQSAQRHML